MPLPESSLSQVCRGIATFVADRLQASQHNIHVRIGNPADAAPGESETNHRVNLFFYRVEPEGFGPSPAPDETWRLRLSCLVTAFGVQEDQVSAGENDLRLLGGVLGIFHEQPVLDALTVTGGNGSGDEVVRTQVIFQPLGVEEINHLWSTQGDVAYRPSVAYELALVPILPGQPRLGGPLVAATGLEVRADMERRFEPFSGEALPPAVQPFRVRTREPGWAPRICLVAGGACAESVAFAVGSPELAAFSPQVWVAGESTAPVHLAWEIWDPVAGWRAGGTPVDTTAAGPFLDPAAVATAPTTAVTLPFTDHAGQAVLYAERTFTRPGDGVSLTVRSNPLLVHLFEVAP